MIRVLLLHDALLMRNMLRILLSTDRDLRLVAEITMLQRFLPRCLELQPHVMLIGGGLRPFIFDIPALGKRVQTT